MTVLREKFLEIAMGTVITLLLGVCGWFVKELYSKVRQNSAELDQIQVIVRHQNELLELNNVEPEKIHKIPAIRGNVLQLQEAMTYEQVDMDNIRKKVDVILQMLQEAELSFTRALTKTFVISAVANNRDSNEQPQIWINDLGPNSAEDLNKIAVGDQVKVAMVGKPDHAVYLTVGGHVHQANPIGDQTKVPDVSLNKPARDALGMTDQMGWADLYIEIFAEGVKKHPLKSLSLYLDEEQ